MPSGTAGNGWPANSDPDAIDVDPGFDCAGVTFPGGMKAGDVSTVLGYVFDQLDARVEAPVPGWCWGYYWKANTNNPDSLSNHAAAAAGDWNAPNHPNGASDPYEGFSDDQVAEIFTILDEVDGVVRWGATYSGTKDPMHFEINTDPATLAEVADRLREQETDMGLTADDREWISGEIARQLTKVASVSTDDEAADGNPNTYTIAGGIARAVRLSSFTATGQVLEPH